MCCHNLLCRGDIFTILTRAYCKLQITSMSLHDIMNHLGHTLYPLDSRMFPAVLHPNEFIKAHIMSGIFYI